MRHTALTDTKIRNLKAKAERYREPDGLGLYIEVTPAKGKYWRYRYKLGGKENLFAAGEWCEAPDGETVAQAQERRDSGRLTLAEARAARVGWQFGPQV